jgi:8-oxo-dGTP pyrophosphatase MutT (NUDIX family)
MIGSKFITKYFYQKINYVLLIIINENNDLLVSQRNNQLKPMYDHYQCIGGKIDTTDNTINDAIKRETEEETGINLDNLMTKPQYSFKYTQKGFNYFPKQPYQFVKRVVYVYELKSSIRKIKDELKQNKEPDNFTPWIWKTINDLQKKQCITSIEKYIQNELRRSVDTTN